ncbi:MAG: YnbE family lipoprotein [Planctomycetes bacterium]|nr:YnbE family lipoprotein [Planctomycetota bacterium]MBM4064135.1 YnbE family lipoprotein [Planctomycetota bacterium]
MAQKSIIMCILFFLIVQGCKTEHKVEVEVKPMQITIDVNIRIDKELEDFFGNLDEAAKTLGGEIGASATESREQLPK